MLKKIVLSTLAVIMAFCLILPQFSSAAFGDTKNYLSKIYSGDKKVARQAYFDTPQDFAKDTKGNFYIADTMNNVIRKIDAKTKKVSTLTGTGDYGQIDGLWNRATFSFPEGVEVDRTGNVYIADTGSGKIRKYEKKTGVVHTIVSGLNQPKDVMVRGSELYIADTWNNRVIKCGLSGQNLQNVVENISLPRKLAWRGSMIFMASEGAKGVIGYSLASKKRLTVFRGAKNFGGIVAWRNYLYVVESDNGVYNRLWQVNLANLKAKRLHRILETEMLNYPSQIIVKEKAVTKTVTQKIKNSKKTKRVKIKTTEPVFYILYSGGSSIYRFDKTGAKKSAYLYAGKHRFAQEMGKKALAEVGRPKDFALAPNAKVYFSANNQIFLYNFNTQKLSHVAGHPMDSYTEGTGTKVRLSDPTGVAITKDGKILYIVDRNNNRIRALNTRTKTTRYITGAGEINSSNESENGYQEGGPCKNQTQKGISGCAYFDRPTGIALSKDEKTLYVADASNDRVRKVNIKTGRTSLLSGTGEYGYADGKTDAAKFRGPYSLALSPSGKYLNVADKYNHAIRSIDLASNVVSTLAGGPRQAGYQEGDLSVAKLSIPEYVKYGPDGNLYFSEAGNLRLRMIKFSDNTTQLVAGSGKRGMQNGQKEYARFSNPKGFFFAYGKIYMADFYNDLIKEISR